MAQQAKAVEPPEDPAPAASGTEPGAAAPAAAPKSRRAAPARDGRAEKLAAAQADALSALGNLGYGPADAAQAVAEAAEALPEDAAPEAGALIRDALRLLAPKG